MGRRRHRLLHHLLHRRLRQPRLAPAPGTVRLLKFPLGSGIRVDTGIAQGDVIPPDYDSMVAKIIAWGRDRNEALARLRNALRETTVVIDGGTTNKSFLLDLLTRDEVVSASADTGWLDHTDAGTASGPTPTADIALIAAAVDAHDAGEILVARDDAGACRGIPVVERVDGDANCVPDERAKPDDVKPGRLQSLMICRPNCQRRLPR